MSSKLAHQAWVETKGTMPPLGEEIHVWCHQLQPGDLQKFLAEEALHPAELERGARFHFARDRESFLVSHSILKLLLGRYLGVAPKDLVIREGLQGKPHLENLDSPLYFNLSHSGSLALFAFCAQGEVGIDVEQVNETRDFAGIVQRYFCKEEQDNFAALDAEAKLEYFFRLWTGKEALLKARGEGLHRPLNEVLLRMGDQEKLEVCNRKGKSELGWSVWTLPDPHPGYRAALAAEAKAFSSRLLRWPT